MLVGCWWFAVASLILFVGWLTFVVGCLVVGRWLLVVV